MKLTCRTTKRPYQPIQPGAKAGGTLHWGTILPSLLSPGFYKFYSIRLNTLINNRFHFHFFLHAKLISRKTFLNPFHLQWLCYPQSTQVGRRYDQTFINRFAPCLLFNAGLLVPGLLLAVECPKEVQLLKSFLIIT